VLLVADAVDATPCCAEAAMHFQQFDLASFPPALPAQPPEPEVSTNDLLRELIAVQRDQLNQLRASAQDAGARWRALLARWKEAFPQLPEACREALPILERAYGGIIASLAEELRQNGEDALDSEFALQDFLDRYGMRLGQIGNILNLVAPLAEAAGSQSESS
jgi:hypothetical protein